MTTTTRKFSAIGGLSNGYAISVNAGGNISDSLAIHTDGGQGVVSVKSGSVTGSFNVSGAKFDPSVAKVVNNVKIGDLYRIGLAGLNDNVTINRAETGIFNDADYSIHARISAEGDGATITSEFNISDGASVSGLVDGYSVSITPDNSFSDEVTFKSNSPGTYFRQRYCFGSSTRRHFP